MSETMDGFELGHELREWEPPYTCAHAHAEHVSDCEVVLRCDAGSRSVCSPRHCPDYKPWREQLAALEAEVIKLREV